MKTIPWRLALMVAAMASVHAQPADLIVTKARIWTGNLSQPWAEAVAVRGNRIAAVGKSAEIAKLAGPRTQVIDAAGKLVTPGFNDAHTHFLSGSLGLSRVDLTGICTVPAMQKAVRQYAEAHPEREWITGTGWEYTCFPGGMPNKTMLDDAVKDRPVFLWAYDGHTGWANSKALRIAEIMRDTEWKGFGSVVKDEHGEPTGALLEGAQSLVDRHVPKPTDAEKIAALRQGLAYASSLGITSFQNASGSVGEMNLYRQLEREGGLPMRVKFALSYSAKQLEAIAAEKAHDTRLVKAGAMKFVLDGVIESHTAFMVGDYADKPGVTGKPSIPWDEYREAVIKADKLGIQMYTHAIGSGAIRQALDGYEAAIKANGAHDARFRIEHIESPTPEDIPRFAKLGVMPSMEPVHADPGTVEVWSKAVGKARLPYSFPWRSLEKSGAKLVFSSDWPAVISCDPMRALHNAVNRQTIDGKPAGGWIPEQRVSLETALRAYTVMGAYAEFQEKEKGQIKPGMWADMVMLSQDLFTIPTLDIYKTRVLLTVMDGKVVYERK